MILILSSGKLIFHNLFSEACIKLYFLVGFHMGGTSATILLNVIKCHLQIVPSETFQLCCTDLVMGSLLPVRIQDKYTGNTEGWGPLRLQKQSTTLAMKVLNESLWHYCKWTFLCIKLVSRNRGTFSAPCLLPSFC